MRLVGRWVCTLIGISIYSIGLLILRTRERILVHEAAEVKTPMQLTSRTTQQQVLITTKQQSPPQQTTKETLYADPITTATTATRARTVQPTSITQLETRPTTIYDERLSYRKSCWKPGFSPASGKPTNHTQEDFLINESSPCSGHLMLLVTVHSEIGARSRRDLVRRTWASLSSVGGHRIAVVFVVGASDDVTLQAELRRESGEAADIVQVPCKPDGHPRASACKALYSLLWASRHCSQVDFLLKVDDNAFVNVFHLAALITGRLTGAKSTFYCGTAAGVIRVTDKKNYWYVGTEEWPAAEYPPHCKGLAYLMSGDLVPRLLHCAAWRNYMRLEDVFITGVLGHEALGARLMHWRNGWDAAKLHPMHDGPAVARAIVLTSQEGAPMPTLHRRVWKAALVYSADLI